MRKPAEISAIYSYNSRELFLNDIEKFLTDRVIFRGVYISLYQVLGLDFISAPFNNLNTSVAGQNSWFFLGNSYDGVLDYTKNNAKIDNAKMDLKIKHLAELQNIARQKNIPYVMLIAPNKHTIYEEFLPKWMSIKSSYRFADAILERATKENLYLAFPKKELLEEKKHATQIDKRLYWKDDTYWNNYGAFIAFKSVWSILQSQESFVNLPEFINLQEVEKTNNGDLISIGKFSTTYRDKTSYSYKLNDDFKKRYRKHGHLFAIGDSFINAFMPLFEIVFEKVTRIHWSKMTTSEYEELITKHNPNVIVYQVVERNFPKDGIIMTH